MHCHVDNPLVDGLYELVVMSESKQPKAPLVEAPQDLNPSVKEPKADSEGKPRSITPTFKTTMFT